jgi:hypothetical protein
LSSDHLLAHSSGIAANQSGNRKSRYHLIVFDQAKRHSQRGKNHWEAHSTMSDKRLANEVLRHFYVYLEKFHMKLGDAFEQVKNDAASLGALYQVEETLIPKIAVQFAEQYVAYDDHDLDHIWKLFCHYEGLNEELPDAVAEAINNSVAASLNEEDDDNVDTWEKLSDDARQMSVKAFLHKLSQHRDFGQTEPFLQSPDDDFEHDDESSPEDHPLHAVLIAGHMASLRAG